MDSEPTITNDSDIFSTRHTKISGTSHTSKSTESKKHRKKVKVSRPTDRLGNPVPHKHLHKEKVYKLINGFVGKIDNVKNIEEAEEMNAVLSTALTDFETSSSHQYINVSKKTNVPIYDKASIGPNKRPLHILQNRKDLEDDDSDDPFSQFPDNFECPISNESRFITQDSDSYSDSNIEDDDSDIISNLIKMKNKSKSTNIKSDDDDSIESLDNKEKPNILVDSQANEEILESTGIYIQVTDTDADFIEVDEHEEDHSIKPIPVEQTELLFISQNISTDDCTIVEELVTASPESAEFVEVSSTNEGVMEFIEVSVSSESNSIESLEPDTVQIMNNEEYVEYTIEEEIYEEDVYTYSQEEVVEYEYYDEN